MSGYCWSGLFVGRRDQRHRQEGTRAGARPASHEQPIPHSSWLRRSFVAIPHSRARMRASRGSVLAPGFRHRLRFLPFACDLLLPAFTLGKPKDWHCGKLYPVTAALLPPAFTEFHPSTHCTNFTETPKEPSPASRDRLSSGKCKMLRTGLAPLWQPGVFLDLQSATPRLQPHRKPLCDMPRQLRSHDLLTRCRDVVVHAPKLHAMLRGIKDRVACLRMPVPRLPY